MYFWMIDTIINGDNYISPLIPSLMGYLIFSPVAVIGVVMGHWMNSKLSDKSFFMVINFFIVIASLRLVYLGLMDL